MTSEQKAFIEQFYLELHERLIIYAGASLENGALAEEAVQETFRIACMKPQEFLGSENPRGWIYQTLKNTIRNMKKTRSAAERLLIEYVAIEGSHASFSEDQLSLNITYSDVSHTDEFQLIRELAVEGKSHLEMASKRGISVNACKKRVQRAKELLRRKFQI